MASDLQDKKINSLLKQIVRKSIYEAINLATLQEEDEASDKKEEPKKEEPKEEEPKEDAPVAKQASPVGLVSKENLTLQIVQDELNTMRSGRSVDNATVSGEMEKYYNSLSSDERMDLYTYMTALAKILTGEVSAEDAPDPSDDDDVKEKQPEKKLSDVVKKDEAPSEDTTAPIKVSGTNESVNESLSVFIKTLLKEEL